MEEFAEHITAIVVIFSLKAVCIVLSIWQVREVRREQKERQ